MSNDGANNSRRRFLVGATSVVGAAGAVGAAIPFVGSWMPSAKAKAAGAPAKADISKLQPGQQMTIEWRGKPVWVIRRTEEVLANIDKQNDRVRDPESNESNQPEYAKNAYRSVRPEYLVLTGICTHLGCSPKYHPEVEAMSFEENWMGGFFCPCHGSKFDLAGRVFQGVPAPTNLDVPPHSYDGDMITIGVDGETA